MDIWRQRLVDEIDIVLSQVTKAQEIPAPPRLQIDLSLVLPEQKTVDNRRILLEPFDVDQLRHLLIGNGSQSTLVSVESHQQTRESSPPVPIQIPLGTYVSDDGPLPEGPFPFPPPPVGIATSEPVSRYPPTQSRAIQHLEPDTSQVTTPALSEDVEQHLSKRRKLGSVSVEAEQPAVDKLIEGIFEQIHNPKALIVDNEMTESIKLLLEQLPRSTTPLAMTSQQFEAITRCCRQVTTGGRAARAVEVILQVYWVDCYDARLAALRLENPALRAHEYKRMVLVEACKSLGWSEKELRNRMAIWKGYREIKNAAGWSALIFAGSGIYRFCKYRLGFDRESIVKFENLRTRAEVAADTIQTKWRELLSLVNESIERSWPGHPHDWTVSLTSDQDPLPLPITYRQWDLNFTFENIEESVIDMEQWPNHDPRRFEEGPEFFCKSCSLRQSHLTEDNECECFADLYSPNPRSPSPVQIFRTVNGKNNGLIACCSFARGQAVGEFVGLITKGLADVDLMQSQAGENEPYQIWQGKRGNFTRFMNHSCAPNCQFQTFSWMGVQRIVVVSKGITAGQELTVDYSSWYWENLDKICLCGEPCCRYKDPRRRTTSQDATPMDGNGVNEDLAPAKT